MSIECCYVTVFNNEANTSTGNKIGVEGVNAFKLAIQYQDTILSESPKIHGTGLMRLILNVSSPSSRVFYRGLLFSSRYFHSALPHSPLSKSFFKCTDLIRCIVTESRGKLSCVNSMRKSTTGRCSF